jgi:hypothetical protein
MAILAKPHGRVFYASMTFMLNHPRILFVLGVLLFWLVAQLGWWIRGRSSVPDDEIKDHLALVISATLTLLGLIIGFSFSMATTRYDQRRLYEEGEANSIGTEYVRADLLPAEEGAVVKRLLMQYLHERIDLYKADDAAGAAAISRETGTVQASLWKAVLPQAAAQPTPVTALVVSGMNDVLNSQGYTQFAWSNRIPVSAWGLMIVIALVANGLVGYAAQRFRRGSVLLVVLPLILSVSFFLVADIDSPRGGLIRIPATDLVSLAKSLEPASR